MSPFVRNLLLAFAWVGVTGSLSVTGFAAGFGIGYAILWLLAPILGTPRYLALVPRTLALAGVFLIELVRANFRLAFELLTPGHRMQPAIIALPMRARSPLEIMLLSNLICLTPGSLTVDVSPDGKTLFVHVVYCDDPDRVRKDISERLEARLLGVLR